MTAVARGVAPKASKEEDDHHSSGAATAKRRLPLSPLQLLLIGTISLVSFWRVLAALRGSPPGGNTSKTVETLRRLKVPRDVLDGPKWQTHRRPGIGVEAGVNSDVDIGGSGLSSNDGSPSLSAPTGEAASAAESGSQALPADSLAQAQDNRPASAAKSLWDSLPPASSLRSKQTSGVTGFERGDAASPYIAFTFGSSHDLALHKKTEGGRCWEHFDFGWLERWDDEAKVFCTPPGTTAEALISQAQSVTEEQWLQAREEEKKRQTDKRNSKPAAEPKDAFDQKVSSGGGGSDRPAPPKLTMGRRLLHALTAATTAQAGADTKNKASWLVCRVMVDEHLPPPTAPHTMCDGLNVAIDFSKLNPTRCPANRPGYKCDGEPVFWAYQPGALRGNCAKEASVFKPSSFPRDHLMDLLGDGWSPQDYGQAPGAEAAFGGSTTPRRLSAAKYTLFVTRERGEHANLFHASTDLMNAFFTLHTVGALDGHAGTREGIEDVQVVLLDEQQGPFEATLWKQVFSPKYPVLRASSLVKAAQEGGGSPVRLVERALFVPPGYTNLLLSSVTAEGDCHGRTQLMQSFRAFVLAGMGLEGYVEALNAIPPAKGVETAKGRTEHDAWPLRVTLVSRRPYHVAGVDHASFMGRQLDNEGELVQAMQGADQDTAIRTLDFAQLSIKEQVETIATTDILVAMHGAALSYASLLPPHAGVLELWPKDRDMWRCFEHLSTMSGMAYSRWENKDPSRFRSDTAGDYTRPDPQQVASMFKELATTVRNKIAKTMSGEGLFS